MFGKTQLYAVYTSSRIYPLGMDFALFENCCFLNFAFSQACTKCLKSLADICDLLAYLERKSLGTFAFVRAQLLRVGGRILIKNDRGNKVICKLIPPAGYDGALKVWRFFRQNFPRKSSDCFELEKTNKIWYLISKHCNFSNRGKFLGFQQLCFESLTPLGAFCCGNYGSQQMC